MPITNAETNGLTQSEFDAMEGLIDRRGIESVLMVLSELCGAKSEHILSNWQDRALAKRWATVAGAIGVAVPHATGL